MPCVTCDRSSAAATFLGKQLSKAVRAEGLLLAAGELISGQRPIATGAVEALTVEGGVLVRYSTFVDHLRRQKFMLTHVEDSVSFALEGLDEPKTRILSPDTHMYTGAELKGVV